MKLNELFDINKKKKTKRVGRGIGSGKGKTCGAGHKGQRARTGVAIKGFEGRQMPLTRRLPKRGFINANKLYIKTVNIEQIQNLVNNGKLNPTLITKLDLQNAGLISNPSKSVKLLAKGELKNPINLEIDYFSKSAEEKVIKSGGKINSIAQ